MLKIFKHNQDVEGQAPRECINSTRVSERDIDVLLGLCQGVMADGAVTQQEAEFLLSWIESNLHISDQWPGNILFARLTAVLADGVLDTDEERDILGLLIDIAGVKTGSGEQTSVSLPYSDPMPDIIHEESTFCVTGKFAAGTRREVEGEIQSRGGHLSKTVSQSVDYVVIGEFSSRDWAHKTFGRKIEKAVKYHEKGFPVEIVSEQHWIKSLATDQQDPQKTITSVTDALAGHAQELRDMGWHVEIGDDRCELFRYFKNGKPRKSSEVAIYFSEFDIRSGWDNELEAIVDTQTKSDTPWRVTCSANTYPEFKSLQSAAKRFIALARSCHEDL